MFSPYVDLVLNEFKLVNRHYNSGLDWGKISKGLAKKYPNRYLETSGGDVTMNIKKLSFEHDGNHFDIDLIIKENVKVSKEVLKWM